MNEIQDPIKNIDAIFARMKLIYPGDSFFTKKKLLKEIKDYLKDEAMISWGARLEAAMEWNKESRESIKHINRPVEILDQYWPPSTTSLNDVINDKLIVWTENFIYFSSSDRDDYVYVDCVPRSF